MSYKNSNLYASRVFAEHPLALWSMDEEYYYISLLSESAKKVQSIDWDVFEAESHTPSKYPADAPVSGDFSSSFFLSTSSSMQYVKFIGPEILYSDMDEQKGSICFSVNIFSENSNIASYDIGFMIDGIEYVQNILIESSKIWQKISHTVNIVENKNVFPVLKVNYNDNYVPGLETSLFYLNGPTVGQWSEPYNSKNNGIIPEPLPLEVSSLLPYPELVNGLPIDSYGLSIEDNGYIVQERNRLLVEKSGIPMIYGSKNNFSILGSSDFIEEDFFVGQVGGGNSFSGQGELFLDTVEGGLFDESFTSIIDGGSPSSSYQEQISGGDSYSSFDIDPFTSIFGGSASSSFSNEIYGGNAFSDATFYPVPSMIFPGKGFLNRTGKYSNLTAEFWLRINSESTDPIRIFGPLSSNDGIYVSSDFITVRVDKYVKSYFIKKWYRPMLLHFGQSISEIFLMINGEKVISINVDTTSINSFPSKEQDFLGFFGNKDINIFDIDCFSIFPYIVSEQAAKKRFVYGQGVEEQESLIENINGDLHAVDFAFSGYNSTISYPDRTKWVDGYYNNVKVDESGLSSVDLSLPELIFTSVSSSVQSEEYVVNIPEQFYYDNLLIQDEEYLFFSMSPSASYNEYYGKIYFSKVNQLTHPSKSIYGTFKASDNVLNKQSIVYMEKQRTEDVFEIYIESGTLHYSFNGQSIKQILLSPLQYFSIGIDFDKISNYYSPIVGSFFENPETLSMNIVGNGFNKFYGKMFSFTINNKFFTDKDGLFDQYGFSDILFTQDKYEYVGSYTLVPRSSNYTIYLDVASSGYWESSIPLSYFGKYVVDSFGNKVYDLDLLQFNIDSPTTSFYIEDQKSATLQESYSVKPFITIQDSISVGTKPYTDYVATENISQENKVLNFDEETELDTTKFLVSDNTVIFPPKNIGYFGDYYVTIHIEIKSSGVKTSPVKIGRMSIVSLSFDESQFFGIGTLSGKKVYPIVKEQDQYVYDVNNPIIINTESSPYLYLTKESGIKVAEYGRGDGLTRGMSFPINAESRSSFIGAGLQMFFMFNRSRTFTENITAAKIISPESSVDMILLPESDSKRALVKFVDSNTKIEKTDYKLFLNGKFVNDIFIRPLEWNMITVSFEDSPINLDSSVGQLEVYSGISVDNISVFKRSSEISTIRESSNEWVNVLRSLDLYGAIDEEFDWAYWNDLNSGSAYWSDVLNYQRIVSTRVGIDGERVYNSYAGLSFAIADDTSTFSVNYDGITVLNDVGWNTFEVKPI